MNRNRSATYAAIVEWLKTINGFPGGYWYDLSDKVFTRLIRPDEDGGLKDFLPYLVVPLDDTSVERVEEFTNAGMKTSWVQPIYGFTRDDGTSPRESANAELLRLRDDLCRLFLKDWTVGGVVSDVQIDQIAVFGPEQGLSYGEIHFMLRIFEWMGADDLGPSAE